MTSKGSTSNVTLTASAPQAAAGGETDVITAHYSSSGGSGSSGTVTYDDLWSTSGTDLTSLTLQGSGGSASCTLSPPVETLAYTPATGSTWSGSGSCPVNGATVTLKESDRVSGTATMAAGSDSVACLVISVTRVITYTSTAGTVTVTTAGTSWLSPALGLEVRDESTTSYSTPSGSSSTSSVLQLDSMHPS